MGLLAPGGPTVLPLPFWAYAVIGMVSFSMAGWIVYRISRAWLKILTGLAIAWVLTTLLLTLVKTITFYS